MRIRNWPIRAKILVLVVPPLASLLAMWIFATTVLLGPALDLLDIQTISQESGRPAQAVIAELQKERKQSLIYLGSGRADVDPLTDQRGATDAVADTYRKRATGSKIRSAENDLVRQRIDDAIAALDRLGDGRANIDRGALDRNAAADLYNSVIDTMTRVFGAVSNDESLARAGRALVVFGRATELLSQEDALISGMAAAGKLQAGDQQRLASTVGAARYVFTDVGPEFSGADRAEFDKFIRSDAFLRLHGLEDRIIDDGKIGAPLPIELDKWKSAYDAAGNAIHTFVLGAADRLIAEATPAAETTLVKLGVAGIVGLIAFILSTALTIRVGRQLIRRLTSLRMSALELADERLPGVVRRLRQGEELDVEAEAPELALGSDEIGEVGKAFSAVQRTAVESAIQEARLRRGLNDVFLNIARRSQTLLHRQLSLLDKMERRSADPEDLEDLFRVDHLATRMRRHAEDLVILAGATPGRGWRNPVPLVDVIRGAVSEVEDYSRVGLQNVPKAALVGRAVADVIHLLAEIIENATSFSPPHTRVQVSGEHVPNGFAIEIEDRGLGMGLAAIAEANDRLANPPDFDPANSARLGLFVVSLLAARHHIKVTLRPSAYGGVTAIVLIPLELVAPAEERLSVSRVIELPVEAAVIQAPAQPNGLGHTSRPHQLAQPTQPARSPAHAAPPEPAQPVQAVPVTPPEPELTDDGLPRRRRQASAPQPRGPENTPEGDPMIGVGGRSPDQIKDMMSSFQRGLVRGRRDAADYSGDQAREEGNE
jgi:hypothetical protein